MRFWDASALVPLLTGEAGTADVRSLLERDGRIVVSWITEVECASALARRERESVVRSERIERGHRRLDLLRAEWSEVGTTDPVREIARRLLRTHPLRAADSLQLSSALVISEHRPRSLPFVCLDDRLRAAAAREGFPVLP
ncbi:MAG: type II toxin-antitoxin system VapC family toxin [Planctomycetota bacterium]